MRTKGEGAKAAQAAVSEYRQQHRSLQQQADETAQAVAEVQNEFKSTLEQLALKVMPDAHPQRVQFVAQALETPQLMAQRQIWTDKIPGFQSRLGEIALDSDFRERAELLDPHTGKLARGLAEAHRYQTDAQRENDPYLTEDFQWVVQRENQKAEGVSMLQGFLRAVTFAETRETRAKKKLVEQFGAPDWETLHSNYQKSVENLAFAADRLHKLETRKVVLESLIAEQRDLERWVVEFEPRLTAELQSMVVDVLPYSNPTALRSMPGDHVPLTSKVHALQAKMKYLGCLQSYLTTEAMDRQDRARKIERVQRLWERKPWDPLSGDKTKWLVTVPAMKKTSTEKRVRWSRDMRRGIHDYDDYDSYEYYYGYYDNKDSYFLPYDVFAYSYEESMPYEGFSGEVIPDIHEHRADHDLEKADYSEFKDLDKQYGALGPSDTVPDEEALESGSDSDGSDGAAAAAGFAAGAVMASEMAAAQEAAQEAALAAEEASMEADFADAS
jgi:hypothetical protein